MQFIGQLPEDIKSAMLGFKRKFIPLIVNYKYEDVVLRILNYSDILSKKDLIDLGDFITQELQLFTIEEFSWLESITIDTDRRLPAEGSWICYFRKNEQGIDGVYAKIFLNAAYLTKLEDFRKVLAHEYGHHWTIIYFVKNHGFRLGGMLPDRSHEIAEIPVPDEYYRIRGINRETYPPVNKQSWVNSALEVIAEDYRVISAPSPYNKNHAMEKQLMPPGEEVRLYLASIRDTENLTHNL
jgi:hypothetical protein